MAHTVHMNQPTNLPPAPLEWHPAYRDHTWLLDWLEGRSEFRQDAVQIPFVSPMRLEPYDPGAPIVPDVIRAHTLTKRKAIGLAPYVGRPFVYFWSFAIDDLGRAVAGDTRIRYADPDYTFCSGSFDHAWDARNGHDSGTPVWP